MQESKLAQKRLNVIGSNQCMVVVRQDTPGIVTGCKLFARGQQGSLKAGHSLVTESDVVFVFVA